MPCAGRWLGRFSCHCTAASCQRVCTAGGTVTAHSRPGRTAANGRGPKRLEVALPSPACKLRPPAEQQLQGQNLGTASPCHTRVPDRQAVAQLWHSSSTAPGLNMCSACKQNWNGRAMLLFLLQGCACLPPCHWLWSLSSACTGLPTAYVRICCVTHIVYYVRTYVEVYLLALRCHMHAGMYVLVYVHPIMGFVMVECCCCGGMHNMTLLARLSSVTGLAACGGLITGTM